MAASKGQRVAAFLLALGFLLSTIGFTAYVIVELNSEDQGIIAEDSLPIEQPPEVAQQQEAASGEEACGQATYAAEGERSIPETVTAETPVNELQTIDVKEGDGAVVQPGDCVAALYYGTLAESGETFDGKDDDGTPIEFSLNGVIQGWTEGIPGMKVGGVRRLVIPAAQAYGEQERPGIPANSDLVFEVEIVNARQTQ